MLQNGTEARIRRIQELYRAVTAEVAQSHRPGVPARLFEDRWQENVNGQSVAAVGEYSADYHFHYGFRSDEEPYADRLTFVTFRIRRAGRSQEAEYLYGASGTLAFALVKTGESETRLYWDERGRPIRIIVDRKTRDTLTATDLREARRITDEGRQLREFWEAKKRLPIGP